MGNLYVSKVTSAGQISLPKEIRAMFGLSSGEYVSLEPKENTLVLQKINGASDPLEHFRQEAARKGITRAQVARAIKSVRAELVKERYGIE